MTKNPEGDKREQATGEVARGGGGPLALLLPTDRGVWSEARRLVANKNVRVEDLAICASQDPIIVLDLLRISNAMFFSGGRSPITSAKTAIIRLGSDVVLETLDRLAERPSFDHPKVASVFEDTRQRAKRVSIVASILAEALARNLTEDAQTAGLFLNTGELLAAAFFGETYVKLIESVSRATTNYRLLQDHKFDCERLGLTYLRRNGIPEALLFAIDREAVSRVPERAILRPLCQAAVEMVEAFDLKRWEKIAPGKILPPKSAVRTLQIPDTQYLRIYERTAEYLFSFRVLEDMRRNGDAAAPAESGSSNPPRKEALTADIGTILESVAASSTPVEAESPPSASNEPVIPRPVEAVARAGVAKATAEVKASAQQVDQFSLASTKTRDKAIARSSEQRIVEPPVINTRNGTSIVTSITDSFASAKRSEELLSQLLESLVDKGPFEKSALIVVSKDRKSAIVVAARGPNIGNGQRLELDDPLSPLAQCFSKVQSFGNRESPVSPFGSRAFALAPIDADHETPVALYADCGNLTALSFEARRIFRTIVDILNQRLPLVPGGIPVEVSVR